MRLATAARSAAGVLLVLGAAWVADAQYFSHGWTAHWYQTLEGERVLVDRTTEHRVAFPNVHRPLARYLQAWPASEHGVPPTLPEIDAVLRARITIPGHVPFHLGARADDAATIWADGEPLGDRALAPGTHDLWIRWRGAPRPNRPSQNAAQSAYFYLTWGASAEPTSAVPRWALTPADGGGVGRALLWVAAASLGLLLALAIVWIERGAEAVVRRRRAGVALAVAIAVFGLGVRGFDYDVMPEFRENADELFATWNGWSLLHDGTTRGWSSWATRYRGRAQIRVEEAFGETFYVITPYFEHPPLMHLMVGAAAHAGGAQHYLHAKLRHTRLVPIGLMAVATFLMVAVGRRLWPGSWSPWVGAGFFNVLPHVTLQTRVIKEEDLLLVLLLAGVLFFLRWRDDGQRTRDWVGAAICVGLAPLAKVPGITFIVGLTALFVAQGGWWAGVRVAAVAGGIGSLLLVYAAAIDWGNFMFALHLQSARAITWNIFANFYDLPRINHNEVGRGWTLFLWLAYVATVYSRGLRGSAPLTVPPLVYLVAIAVASGNWSFGWYVVPLYPFLCLGAGDFVVRTWRQPTFLAGLLMVSLLSFYSLNFLFHPATFEQPTQWPMLRAMITGATIVLLAPFGAAELWPQHPFGRRLGRLGVALSLAVTIAASLWFVARYDVIFETHRELDAQGWFV